MADANEDDTGDSLQSDDLQSPDRERPTLRHRARIDTYQRPKSTSDTRDHTYVVEPRVVDSWTSWKPQVTKKSHGQAFEGQDYAAAFPQHPPASSVSPPRHDHSPHWSQRGAEIGSQFYVTSRDVSETGQDIGRDIYRKGRPATPKGLSTPAASNSFGLQSRSSETEHILTVPVSKAQPNIQSVPMADHDLPQARIAKCVKACFDTFSRLRSVPECDATNILYAIVARSAWEDEAGRLRVWSGNLGAHQNGSSSLSYRLRHAPSIKQEIIEALEVLLDALDEMVKLIKDGLSGGPVFDEEYVVELYKDVVDSIEGLFRLSTAIRNPSRRDRILERADIDRNMVPFDQNHVRDMFPKASTLLFQRLGRANTQRRANLRYLQRHHDKLAQGLTDEDDDYDSKSKLSGTIATNLEAHLITGQQDDSVSVTASATSYAPSLFASTKRFPSKPKPTTPDGRFECPLCFYIIKTDSIAAWRKHVFVDLQPYVCLLESCSYANKLFVSRREWYTHEKQEHFNWDQSLSQCPLCLEALSSLTAEKHLGRHLEDIALFTLPSALFDGEEEEELGSHSEKEDSTWEKVHGMRENESSTLKARERRRSPRNSDTIRRSRSILEDNPFGSTPLSSSDSKPLKKKGGFLAFLNAAKADQV